MTRTTLDIDDALLTEAVRLSRSKSKTGAIEEGLRLLVRDHQRKRLLDELGTFELDLDLEALHRLRETS